MPVGAPVAGSFSAWPGPPSVTLKSLVMPLSFRASVLREASGPVANTAGLGGGAPPRPARVGRRGPRGGGGRDWGARAPSAGARAPARRIRRRVVTVRHSGKEGRTRAVEGCIFRQREHADKGFSATAHKRFCEASLK